MITIFLIKYIFFWDTLLFSKTKLHGKKMRLFEIFSKIVGFTNKLYLRRSCLNLILQCSYFINMFDWSHQLNDISIFSHFLGRCFKTTIRHLQQGPKVNNPEKPQIIIQKDYIFWEFVIIRPCSIIWPPQSWWILRKTPNLSICKL